MHISPLRPLTVGRTLQRGNKNYINIFNFSQENSSPYVIFFIQISHISLYSHTFFKGFSNRRPPINRMIDGNDQAYFPLCGINCRYGRNSGHLSKRFKSVPSVPNFLGGLSLCVDLAVGAVALPVRPDPDTGYRSVRTGKRNGLTGKRNGLGTSENRILSVFDSMVDRLCVRLPRKKPRRSRPIRRRRSRRRKFYRNSLSIYRLRHIKSPFRTARAYSEYFYIFKHRNNFR